MSDNLREDFFDSHCRPIVIVKPVYLKMSSVNVVGGIFQLGNVERIQAGTNCLGSLLLYPLFTVHQIRLDVRVYRYKHIYKHNTLSDSMQFLMLNGAFSNPLCVRD